VWPCILHRTASRHHANMASLHLQPELILTNPSHSRAQSRYCVRQCTRYVAVLRLPGLKAQGFWLSFHASRLRVGQTGSCVGPLRLSSRRTLALIQLCASEADASSFVRSTFSLSRLPPASGRCRVAPTERAPCLLASWDNYSTHVQQRQVFLPAGSRLFIPA
jgi:hypothetical protein